MLQSSITAWLKKPASVTHVPPPPPTTTTTTPQQQPVASSSANSTTSAIPQNATPSLSQPASPEPLQSSSSPRQNATIANPFTLQPLPSNVELVPLTAELMPAFKRLNALLLPIAYPQSYYDETMTEPHHSLTLMALWYTEPDNDSVSPTTDEKPNQPSNPISERKGTPRLIGAIRCRLLPSATLYISTLGLLSPYRSHGIATHLLHNVAAIASKDHGIKCITAHVWEANDVGLEWYAKRGFEILEKENAYYRKLKPSGAMLVRKWIGVSDLLSISNNSTNAVR